MSKLCWGIVPVLLFVSPVLAAGVTTWNVPGDFATLQEANDSALVAPGHRVLLARGNHAGALITKSLVIEGRKGAVVNSGPLHASGLSYGLRMDPGSDGSQIRGLVFDGVDLAIMNSFSDFAQWADNVTVTGNVFRNAVQAVSAWRGSGWVITKNTIEDLRTDCGGGIGILIGDYNGGTVQGNLVRQNVIRGTVHVHPLDCGGYNATGIVLFADFRWGGPGAAEISGNQVSNNRISLTINDPRVGTPAPAPIDAVAIELTEARDDTATYPPVIFDNAVSYNDLRGTAWQLDLTPDTLDEVNSISRNLGENRGHGLHPTLLKPLN